MVRLKEIFNDEDTLEEREEEKEDEDLSGYDEEQDWIPILVDEDEDK
mgnify:CR=1 FL=1